MAAEQRRQLILARATEFFAEHGVTAQTRVLAKVCGVAQRLLYRHFPSKAALLAEVYQDAIIAPFRPAWIVDLKDRTRPFEERLTTFYLDYYEAVLTRKWLRLFLFSSLGEANMASNYTDAILLETLETIVREAAHEQSLTLPRNRALLHEIGWVLHGAVSHLAIRRHIYRSGSNAKIKEAQVLALHVRCFLSGFATVVEAACSGDDGGARQPSSPPASRQLTT